MPDRSSASLLQQLVRIPSVNPRGAPMPAEAAIGAAVAGWLRDAGLEVELQTVLPGRPNVLARVRGRDRSRVFLLESHLDTVETDGMTIPPFAAEIREGRLFGRGACDAKGPLAAMMLAMAELASGAPPPVDVMLAAVMDEEHQFGGVTALLARGESFAAAVVGEPTELDLVVAHKGCLRFGVTTHGRACHSSNPWEGENAIMRMAEVLEFIRRALEPEALATRHPWVGPATVCVSLIGGGSAINAVPASCTIHLDRRILPGEEPMAVWAAYRARLEAFAPGTVSVGEPYLVDYAMATDPAEPVAQQMEAALRRAGRAAEVRGVNYGTDASKLARAGIPAVVFGPGSIRQAHSADEWIELRQVDEAAAILAAVVRAFA